MIDLLSVEAICNNSVQFIRGVDAARLIAHLWYIEFPDYLIELPTNADLYGSIVKVGMDDRKYFQALADKQQFPEGVIVFIMRIILDWNKRLLKNEVSDSEWQTLRQDARIVETNLFLIEFQ